MGPLRAARFQDVFEFLANGRGCSEISANGGSRRSLGGGLCADWWQILIQIYWAAVFRLAADGQSVVNSMFSAHEDAKV